MASRRRTTVVGVGATAGSALLVGWLLPSAIPAGAGFPDLLVAGCAGAGVVAVGWCWATSMWVVVEALRGAAPQPRVPQALRRVVLAACGLSLAGGLIVPAQAARAPAGPGRDESSAAAALAGLPVPDRTTTTTQWLGSVAEASAPRANGPSEDDAGRGTGPETGSHPAGVVVTPGDTLWSLAGRTLPPGASPQQVERRWREIYAANREVVGADPDLIRPGQRLVLPPTTAQQHR